MSSYIEFKKQGWWPIKMSRNQNIVEILRLNLLKSVVGSVWR